MGGPTGCTLQVLLPCPLLKEVTDPMQPFVPYPNPTHQCFIWGTHYPLTKCLWIASGFCEVCPHAVPWGLGFEKTSAKWDD